MSELSPTELVTYLAHIAEDGVSDGVAGRNIVRHFESQCQRIAELEAEVARLNKVMDPIDQECCDLQEKWKAEAQWAAKQIVDHGALHPDSQQDIWHAQRILNGKL